MSKNLEKATFAAGCFWGIEDTFCKVPGVVETIVGYAGGVKDNPTYEEVLTGKTGHAESIRVKFDLEKISYKDLLNVFWSIHDPTTLNQQGPDIGTNYRSIIFFHNAEQKKLAEESKKKLSLSGKFKNPIVTEIISAGKFWRAEEYHQKYFAKQGGGSCRL